MNFNIKRSTICELLMNNPESRKKFWNVLICVYKNLENFDDDIIDAFASYDSVTQGMIAFCINCNRVHINDELAEIYSGKQVNENRLDIIQCKEKCVKNLTKDFSDQITFDFVKKFVGTFKSKQSSLEFVLNIRNSDPTLKDICIDFLQIDTKKLPPLHRKPVVPFTLEYLFQEDIFFCKKCDRIFGPYRDNGICQGCIGKCNKCESTNICIQTD